MQHDHRNEDLQSTLPETKSGDLGGRGKLAVWGAFAAAQQRRRIPFQIPAG